MFANAQLITDMLGTRFANLRDMLTESLNRNKI